MATYYLVRRMNAKACFTFMRANPTLTVEGKDAKEALEKASKEVCSCLQEAYTAIQIG